MKLPKQEFKVMTRIKLIQFWTCFVGIVLTHPRHMNIWSVFWAIMLMYLPMVVGVCEIIMLRLRAFKDYGQLIFHVFVCFLWLLGLGLLTYIWLTEDNLTTLSHILYYMNLFLGFLFLVEIGIFVHVVRARINFLKMIDKEIDARERQEQEASISRSSITLTRSEFVSRETILEKEKRELIQSIKVRLENEMKMRESEELGSGKSRNRSVELAVINGVTDETMLEDRKSEQVATTSKAGSFVDDLTTAKSSDDHSIEYLRSRSYEIHSGEEPRTSKTGEDGLTEDPKDPSASKTKIDNPPVIDDNGETSKDPTTKGSRRTSSEDTKLDDDPKTIQDSTTQPSQEPSEATPSKSGGENTGDDQAAPPNETEPTVEEDVKVEEDGSKSSKKEEETNNGEDAVEEAKTDKYSEERNDNVK